MTTSCGSVSHGDLSQVRELALVQDLMADYLNRLMPGPANSAGNYQLKTGGSLLRACLALASGRAFGSSKNYRVAAAAACEFIHNASLVHDDLLDRDAIRRGAPSVWKQYGDGIALCTGDLLLCAAFGVAADLDDPRESRLLSQHTASMAGRIIVGQSVEIAHSGSQSLPTLRAYLEATTAKTAPLIELPLITGAAAGGADHDTQTCIREFASTIGLAYQIIDDLDDLDANRQSLHAFHAWHHHRHGGNSHAEGRIERATQHAIASLKRGRRLLEQLEGIATNSLEPTIGPLLSKLEQRALAHRLSNQSTEEPDAYERVVAG
ncbi:polyprenyl synthetase family protein [Marinobacter sp. ATCH36]|uniref:polyprenyl synthetase family protein n=1 Tax=Marinobacter sp. ATCH36 TaxID=2945106 RepID=UPI0020203518|nr:polyprenyl synthetase family protein [Marinobacter sp. ATCH36]MCL7945506.1 polyprenyl synthetase family protein [Marinobacter sp. ATCH36]